MFRDCMGTAADQSFSGIVRSTFDTWKVLRYAAANHLGGDVTEAKLEWMVDTVAAFITSQTNVSESQVEAYIEEILDNEFDLLVEDGSGAVVARCLCQCFECWRAGDQSGIETIFSQLRKANGYADESHAQTLDQERCDTSASSDAASGDDDEEQHMDMDSSHQDSSSSSQQKHSEMPPAADDEWTVAMNEETCISEQPSTSENSVELLTKDRQLISMLRTTSPVSNVSQDISGVDFHISYFETFLTRQVADQLFQYCETSLKYYDGDLTMVKVFNRWHRIPRKQVAFGDIGYTYHFSGNTIPANPWNDVLDSLRQLVSDAVKCPFNFVLVNR
ncbi:unnamed protein product [Soboliphyme baturini]|uniref:Pre-rRNA-processing protein TSR2 homolog n=1 Tax=Soboliphyme baturini TaxID=241478 RepID=A0A183J656_9BILA|nr:unnamed protein product [Soboliphyme baturini]